MKLLQRNLLVVACLATLAASTGAQQAAAGRSVERPGSAAVPSPEMTEGEVRKVDKSAKKLTIKHGEIKNLDMPPMTMVFQVRDGALLEALKAGDKIRFVAEKTPSGYAVIELRLAP